MWKTKELWASAISLINLNMKQVPDDLNANLLYGQALFNDWRYFHARAYFKKLAKLYPDNPYAEQWYRNAARPAFWTNIYCVHWERWVPMTECNLLRKA